jgi:hypothetical protein
MNIKTINALGKAIKNESMIHPIEFEGAYNE